MPVPRGGSAADKRSAEIAHLRKDKGYSMKRAAAAAYSMYGEEAEYEELEGLMVVDPEHPLSGGGHSVVNSKTGKRVAGPFHDSDLARSALKAHGKKPSSGDQDRDSAGRFEDYEEENEYEDLLGTAAEGSDSSASAASPRFDEQELRRLLELCREARRRR